MEFSRVSYYVFHVEYEYDTKIKKFKYSRLKTRMREIIIAKRKLAQSIKNEIVRLARTGRNWGVFLFFLLTNRYTVIREKIAVCTKM